MCISGAIFEYEASYIDEKENELKGWGFDVDVLRASEGGVSPLLDRRSPRAFSTNVSNDIPGFEGTKDELDKLSIYKKGDNLPDGMSPNGNRCEYSGLRSTSSYM